MDCFGTYFTHAQTCNVTRVQSATEWTASVHTLHMPKHVMCNVTRVQSATEKKTKKTRALEFNDGPQ